MPFPEQRQKINNAYDHAAKESKVAPFAGSKLLERKWRRGSGSNRRIKVLQTSPLPLGYRAPGHTAYLTAPDTRSRFRGVYRRRRVFWSGRPGSNRRHLPWQGSTLPLSYSRPAKVEYSGAAVDLQRVYAPVWMLTGWPAGGREGRAGRVGLGLRAGRLSRRGARRSGRGSDRLWRLLRNEG